MSNNSGEHFNEGDREPPLTLEQASGYVCETYVRLIREANSKAPLEALVRLDNGVVLANTDGMNPNDREKLAINGVVPQIIIGPDKAQKSFYGFSKEGILHEISSGFVRFKDHPILGTCNFITGPRIATPVNVDACLGVLGKLITGKPTSET